MKNVVVKRNIKIAQKQSSILFKDIAALIEKSKATVQRNVNQALTLLNWHIGKRLEETLQNTEENYGLAIVTTVSQLLQKEYGNSYTKSSISSIRNFYKLFPKIKIVATLAQLLSCESFCSVSKCKK